MQSVSEDKRDPKAWSSQKVRAAKAETHTTVWSVGRLHRWETLKYGVVSFYALDNFFFFFFGQVRALPKLHSRYLSVQETCSVRDACSIRGSGRSPGEGRGNPLQCSCLENSKDSGTWQTTVHRVTQSQTGVKRLSTHTLTGTGHSMHTLTVTGHGSGSAES